MPLPMLGWILDASTQTQGTSWTCPRPLCRKQEGQSNQLTVEIVVICLLGTTRLLTRYKPQGSMQKTSASQGHRLRCCFAETFYLGEQKLCNQTTSRNLHQQMLLQQHALDTMVGTMSSFIGSNISNRPFGISQGASPRPPALVSPQHTRGQILHPISTASCWGGERFQNGAETCGSARRPRESCRTKLSPKD